MRSERECPTCLGEGRIDIMPCNSPSSARYITCGDCYGDGTIAVEVEEPDLVQVSPYLLLPLRTIEQAKADIAAKYAQGAE